MVGAGSVSDSVEPCVSLDVAGCEASWQYFTPLNAALANFFFSLLFLALVPYKPGAEFTSRSLPRRRYSCVWASSMSTQFRCNSFLIKGNFFGQ